MIGNLIKYFLIIMWHAVPNNVQYNIYIKIKFYVKLYTEMKFINIFKMYCNYNYNLYNLGTYLLRFLNIFKSI